MKRFIKYLTFFLVLPFITNGCYTVLWTPEDELPDEANYESYDSYYIEDYHYYYDYPWWLTFTPPGRENTGESQTYERDKGTTSLRNNGNGRNSSDNGREILNTPPPTRSNTTPSSGSDNNTESTSKTRTDTDNSSNSNTNTRQSSGSNNNNTRNNDGSRNNGRGR